MFIIYHDFVFFERKSTYGLVSSSQNPSVAALRGLPNQPNHRSRLAAEMAGQPTLVHEETDALV